MCRTKNSAEETYSELKENASNIGLKINLDKTKILVQTRRQRNYGTINNIEKVNNFKYLGTILEINGTEEAEIRNRIVQTNKAAYGISSIFRSKDIHRNTKLRIYKSIIRPILTYGCETCIMNSKAANTLDTLSLIHI